MTDLTEQWKKGELPEGWYFVILNNGKVNIAKCSNLFINCGRKLKRNFAIDNVAEVIEPVPSYEEWKGKDEALTALLAEYGKLTKELQDEKEKHMTRFSLRSPADEVIIEKQVWESTLHRSMVLQAENAQLKELLRECELWFTGMVGNMNDKNVGEHNKSVPIGNFEHIFKEFSQKINEALK